MFFEANLSYEEIKSKLGSLKYYGKENTSLNDDESFIFKLMIAFSMSDNLRIPFF